MSHTLDTADILIASDSGDNQTVLGEILGQAGYSIRIAANGRQLMETARANPPDLILLDVRMPGMDGDETCRCLKASGRLRTVPVLLLIDSADTEEMVRGFSCGAADHITKPFRAETVLARVQTHLKLREYEKRLEQFSREISHREIAEEALRESESRLKEAQQMARLGHWFWDVKTGEVDWSPEVYRIFGLDPDTFTPQIDSILELSPWPEDHQRDRELIQKVIESHEQGTYEQRFLRPDGSVGYYASSFAGVYDENNELLVIRGTVFDITERKTALEELHILNGLFALSLQDLPLEQLLEKCVETLEQAPWASRICSSGVFPG